MSGAYTLLSTPVMVTAPVLLVDPGAMVRVLLDVMAKSPLTAGDTGDAETTTVTSWEEAPLSEAVTLAVPPFSPMEDELRSRVTVGAASSSVMVRVWLKGALTPSPPLTAADTVTDLSGASTLLSTPVMVTAPVLLVDPAAMVRVLLDAMVKSPLTAGDTGDAETTTVTSWEEAPLSEAVTLVVPPFSPMEDELRLRVTVGAASSSVMVSVKATGSVTPSAFEEAPDIVTVLSGASTPLSMALTVSAPALVASPGAIVNVGPLRA